jgi:hypothetical protein
MKKNIERLSSYCEVVRVDSPLFLVDAGHHARRYETADGRTLDAGYYLVVYSDKNQPFGRQASYIGPVASGQAAQVLASSAVGLGIAEMANADGHATRRLSVLQPKAPVAGLGFLLGRGGRPVEACYQS